MFLIGHVFLFLLLLRQLLAHGRASDFAVVKISLMSREFARVVHTSDPAHFHYTPQACPGPDPRRCPVLQTSFPKIELQQSTGGFNIRSKNALTAEQAARGAHTPFFLYDYVFDDRAQTHTYVTRTGSEEQATILVRLPQLFFFSSVDPLQRQTHVESTRSDRVTMPVHF